MEATKLGHLKFMAPDTLQAVDTTMPASKVKV